MRLDELLKDFETMNWQMCLDALRDSTDEYVYVFIFRRGDLCIPFYVGQTKRLLNRMWDYKEKHFKAPTDFRVGEAIAHLLDQEGCSVDVKYKRCFGSEIEEARLVRNLQLVGFRLLNGFGYKYKSSNPETERNAIHGFCKIALLSTR
jgi:hypothetical protein